MRRYSWAVGLVVLSQCVITFVIWCSVAGAQPPQTSGSAQLGAPKPTPTPAPPPDVTLNPNDPLDGFLMKWEKAMTTVETLVAQMSRTEVNMTFQSTDIFQGSAKFMKPNYAMLEMAKKNNPEQFEKFVCSGETLFQYVPAQKEVRAHKLPPRKNGVLGDDSFLSFLFGMKAVEAKRRYDLKLAKEDQYYVYIDVTPRFDADKADFQRARMVLYKSNFMPRQLWFEQPNKDTVTWDIPTVETQVALKKEDFQSPPTPAGWKMKEVSRTDLPDPKIRGTKP